MAVMICRPRRCGREGSVPPQPSRTLSFSDIPASYWAWAEVLRAAGLQIVNGYSNGVFLPESKAERCQAAAVLARALRLHRNAAGS